MTELDIVGSPIWFAEEVLKQPLYLWQDWTLTQIEDPRKRAKVSLAAPNGSGKSERVIATAALWWVWAHLRATVVITTKDGKQLDNQIWPAIRKHAEKFPEWKFNERFCSTPTGGRIICFTTDEPGRAEGWHKENDSAGPLLMIVDEAKSVEEGIFQAIDRCTYNALLLISSTGLRQGRFYDSHNSLAASFKTRRVKLEECPHIPKERIDDVIAMYGRDHPFVKSTLFSEFMSQDDECSFLLTLEQFEACVLSPPKIKKGTRTAFIDFAAGGDENVLAIRTGNQVELAAIFRERDTMAAVGRFLLEFKRHGLQSHEIYGDEGGLGKPIIDRLWEVGWQINRVNNGAAAHDDRYKHRGAEIWHEGTSQIARCDVILPNDPTLKAQLTTRKIVVGSDGRLGIEKKEDMKKRGVKSPDRADAILGALTHQPMMVQQYNDPLSRAFEPGESWRDRMEEVESTGPRAGFDAGW